MKLLFTDFPGSRFSSVGMINGLCREFSSKSRQEQDELFMALPDAPVMHVDGTVARVNGNNNNVVVCSNGTATMYFARENMKPLRRQTITGMDITCICGASFTLPTVSQ